MPRSSSGSYTAPAGQPVVTGTAISSTAQNNLVSDLATEITDSLSRSGKGGMTAPMKVPDGTVAAPTLAFTSEPGSGLYRAGAGDVRLARLGSDVLKATAAGMFAAAWGALTAASAIVRGAMADGASAIGVILDSGVALANATSKLVSVQNNGVEKLSVDKDGGITIYGARAASSTVGSSSAQATTKNAVRAWARLLVGAGTTVTVVDGFNVASAFSSPGLITVTFQNALPDGNLCAVATPGGGSGPLASGASYLLANMAAGGVNVGIAQYNSSGATVNYVSGQVVYVAIIG